MKSKGQRQDVAFLALAVSTLAIAIVVMIGVRALSRKPEAKPEPTPTSQAAVPRPRTPPTPVADTKRDPFADQSKKLQAAGKEGTEEPEFKLVGIVSAQEPMAVIRRGGRRYYARAGQMVAGYTVAVIGRDRVTLVKGEERVTLELRRAQPEEEAE